MLSRGKHADRGLLTQYGQAMADSVVHKIAFFGPELEHILRGRNQRDQKETPLKVLNLGSCTSALSIALSDVFGDDVRFVDLDFDPHFVAWGGKNTSQARNSGNFSHIRAEASRLPIAGGGVDVAMTSSFMHEAYSYDVGPNGPFSMGNVRAVMNEISRVLRPGGFYLDRDYVVKPDEPDELLLVVPEILDGYTPRTTEELLQAPIDKLSSLGVFDRFLLRFKPAREYVPTIDLRNQMRRIPAWLVGEALFHMNYRGDAEMWESELGELYGQATKSETIQLGVAAGLIPVKVEVGRNYDPARCFNGGIFNDDGMPIDARERFPTNTQAVFRKPESAESVVDIDGNICKL